MQIDYQKASEFILNGKIGVLPTDTIYGIHGLALNKEVVEKIYAVRDRNPAKPFIILISSIKDLELFDIQLSQKIKDFLQTIWPNKVSVVLPCPNPEFEYLHRGTNSLGFRVPNKDNLLQLLGKTGPLISTSVNPPSQEPAYTIQEAQDYFKDQLDFYLDEGRQQSSASTVIKIEDEKIEILRQGEVEIDKSLLTF